MKKKQHTTEPIYQTLEPFKQNPMLCSGVGSTWFSCHECKKLFKRKNTTIRIAILEDNSRVFCSRKCYRSKSGRSEVSCEQCKKVFSKRNDQICKSKHNFCSSSCAATYNNLHKTTGTRRSKLECWIETQLTELYSNLEILFNNKEVINSELDIYIPSLSLAFELNGIYHYEPIHGSEKLASIQNNDTRKFQACIEKNIELCIIDSSQLKYFKPSKAQKYLDIIANIINIKFKNY